MMMREVEKVMVMIKQSFLLCWTALTEFLFSCQCFKPTPSFT
jgi:hypothetical protein